MGTKVLLCVDDEPNVLNALKRTFRKEGYTTLVAHSGPEALDILQNQPVDMVLSDHLMPDMTGTELLKQVKSTCPHTVRVVLSGYADTRIIEQALQEGDIDWFLCKPWEEEDLRNLIRHCFNGPASQGDAPG